MDVEIGGIEWDAWNEEHIAEHGVARTDVEEICRGRRSVDATREARVRLVGRTRREFLERERRGES